MSASSLPHLKERGAEVAADAPSAAQPRGRTPRRKTCARSSARSANASRKTEQACRPAAASVSTSTTKFASWKPTGGTGRSDWSQIETDIDEEPERIRRTYDVTADRLEPIGLVYLWPVTG